MVTAFSPKERLLRLHSFSGVLSAVWVYTDRSSTIKFTPWNHSWWVQFKNGIPSSWNDESILCIGSKVLCGFSEVLLQLLTQFSCILRGSSRDTGTWQPLNPLLSATKTALPLTSLLCDEYMGHVRAHTEQLHHEFSPTGFLHRW